MAEPDPNEITQRLIAGVLGSDTPDMGAMSAAFGDTEALLRAALEADPDNAELAQLLEQNIAMAALLGRAAGAQADGDAATLSETAQQIAALGGVPVAADTLEGDIAALQDALEEGDLGRTRAVLAQGVDLNAHYGPYDCFPLQWAMRAEDNRVALVRLLLSAGADARFATPEGYTALHDIADSFTATDPDELCALAQCLVEAGGCIEARNHYGWTPVLRAVMEGSADELRALLQAGGDATAVYPAHSMPAFSRGQSALLGAVFRPDKVALLLEHGADAHEDGLLAHIDAQMEDAQASKPGFVSRLLGGARFQAETLAALTRSRARITAARG